VTGHLRRWKTTAAAVTAGFLFFAPATAMAAPETAGAFALKATGPIPIPETPANVSCTKDTRREIRSTAIPIHIPNVGSVDILNARCTRNSSHADVASGDLFNHQLKFRLISADCTRSGATSKFVGEINGQTIGDSDFHDITIPNLIRVRINETTGPNRDGETVQTAVHITLLPQNDQQEDIYLAQARCKVGNRPVIPEAQWAVLLPLTAVSIFGVAFFLMRRRQESSGLAH
jgi:hypothetical protein